MGAISDQHQVSTLVKAHGPVFLMRDADAGGVSRALVRRMLDRGEITRLAKAAFAPTAVVQSASPWEVFRLKAIAFGRSAAHGTYLTGEAAAAVLGLPVVSDPPELPSAIRPGNAHLGHDTTPWGHTRHGYLPVQHRTRRNGVATVSPAYCAVDVARHAGARDGLVVADKVIASGVSREVLAQLVIDMERYPGISTARWVIEQADPRAESPLESLGRLAFVAARHPAPLSNAWIPFHGRWYRADHLLADAGVIVEADGAVKYNNRPDAAALVNNDRDRERDLRSLGFGIARYSWAIAVANPGEIIRRATEAERLRNGRSAPKCWTLDAPW